MRVGVGYSENPDTVSAGLEAAQQALKQAERNGPCDLILLFYTSWHNPEILRDAVISVVGDTPRIIGGGAVGAMTQAHYGYAGDQIGLAAIWLDEVECQLFSEGDLGISEEAVGQRLGAKMAEASIKPDTPVLMFYDAVDRTDEGMRLLMATPLLNGIEQTLGFLPNLVGAGLQGDYAGTPVKQCLDKELLSREAIALSFSDSLRLDSIIMHGCHPATGYYTVTKADQQTILEINGEPAIDFMDKLLNSSISPEQYPLFLILGINSGNKWAEFDENHYASRLCIGIDKARKGIVMFEPDMVEGTEFQIMFRSFDLSYMKPKIEALFDSLNGRTPVFAFYIDCAGRAAGYSGVDLEDAILLQKTMAERVPFLGIYTGVEIASIMGKPRALDWTGVLCLFSVE